MRVRSRVGLHGPSISWQQYISCLWLTIAPSTGDFFRTYPWQHCKLWVPCSKRMILIPFSSAFLHHHARHGHVKINLRRTYSVWRLVKQNTLKWRKLVLNRTSTYTTFKLVYRRQDMMIVHLRTWNDRVVVCIEEDGNDHTRVARPSGKSQSLPATDNSSESTAVTFSQKSLFSCPCCVVATYQKTFRIWDATRTSPRRLD
jgi:hypothetical protein